MRLGRRIGSPGIPGSPGSPGVRSVTLTGALAACALVAVLVGTSGCASVATAAPSPRASSASASPSASATPTPTVSPTPTPSASPGGPPAAAQALIDTLGANPVISTIGDSIMSGYGLPNGQDWPTLIQNSPDETASITNVACPGAGFIAIGQCNTDFAGLIAPAAQSSPTVVIIESSSNDLGESTAAIDSATASTIQQLHARVPGALIVGLSTIWNDQSTVPAEVTTSSAALQSAVAAVGGVYIDVGQPLLGHPELMQSDDVHPTAAGQALLATVLATDLRRLGIAV